MLVVGGEPTTYQVAHLAWSPVLLTRQRVEVVTLIAVMVTLATNQFSLIAYLLAVLGVVTPLALVTWGFLRLARDEARSRTGMRSKEQARLFTPTKPLRPPLHAPKAA